MNLPRIDTGVKDFEMRLWTSSMVDPDYMLVLRKSDTSELSQKYTYNVSFDSLKHFELMKTYQNDSIRQLLDSLQMIDFSKLISQDEVAGFYDNFADGMTYHMEVATPKYYKLISYHCPEIYADTETNNKRFVGLLVSIDKQLHFYSPYFCKP